LELTGGGALDRRLTPPWRGVTYILSPDPNHRASDNTRVKC
jgi:hypothetical protein